MKKIIIGMLSIGLISAGLVGCGGTNTQNPEATKAPVATKLSVVGSTSVDPLAQKLVAAYKAKKPNINIEIQAVGSSAGVKATQDGTADIGMSSRELTQAEIDSGVKPIVIAHDGIAVVTNPKNKVENLTIKQVSDIFMGKVKNWKEVGGEDKEIIVVSRESGSGTRSAFEELAKVQVDKDGKKVSGLYEKALQAEGNGAVKSNIASKDNAIGYLSLGYLDSSVKTAKIDNVEPTVENIKAKKYAISRPFLFLTKGEAKSDAKAFVDFVLGSEGQKIAVDDKYISINN